MTTKDTARRWNSAWAIHGMGWAMERDGGCRRLLVAARRLEAEGIMMQGIMTSCFMGHVGLEMG